MLEHLPRWLGHALGSVRAGADRVAIASIRPGECAAISLGSAAFGDGERIPERFTADGEGLSPPLHWGPLPEGTAALALLVEDADSPSLNPIVHAVVWDLDLPRTASRKARSGRSATARPAATGPRPGATAICSAAGCRSTRPRGMASIIMCSNCSLCRRSPTSSARRGGPRCSTSLAGACWGSGVLTGTYSRDEPADIGPVGEAAAA